MAPQEQVEFGILKLTFSPQLHPEYPHITMTHDCHSPNESLPHLYHWFDLVIRIEKLKILPHLNVRYWECDITTGNEDLFTIYGYRFNNLHLLLGEDTMYWVYHHNNSRERILHGRSRLIDNFCSCCFHEQYLTIMDTVKNITRPCLS